MSDPVAEKSTFLCMYMSNHPDTLVAYVKYWGKVKEHVVSAKMSSIDSNVGHILVSIRVVELIYIAHWHVSRE